MSELLTKVKENLILEHSVEDVKERRMYVEVLAKKAVATSG